MKYMRKNNENNKKGRKWKKRKYPHKKGEINKFA